MASLAERVSLLCEPSGRPLLRPSPLVNVVRVLPNVVVALQRKARTGAPQPTRPGRSSLSAADTVSDESANRLPLLVSKDRANKRPKRGARGHDNRTPSPERHRAVLKARRFPHGAELITNKPLGYIERPAYRLAVRVLAGDHVGEQLGVAAAAQVKRLLLAG